MVLNYLVGEALALLAPIADQVLLLCHLTQASQEPVRLVPLLSSPFSR